MSVDLNFSLNILIAEGLAVKTTSDALTEGMRARIEAERTNKRFIFVNVYHLIRALPQVSPPPKTGRQIRSSGWILPSRTASSNVIAQEAEEMLPYL